MDLYRKSERPKALTDLNQYEQLGVEQRTPHAN